MEICIPNDIHFKGIKIRVTTNSDWNQVAIISFPANRPVIIYGNGERFVKTNYVPWDKTAKIKVSIEHEPIPNAGFYPSPHAERTSYFDQDTSETVIVIKSDDGGGGPPPDLDFDDCVVEIRIPYSKDDPCNYHPDRKLPEKKKETDPDLSKDPPIEKKCFLQLGDVDSFKWDETNETGTLILRTADSKIEFKITKNTKFHPKDGWFPNPDGDRVEVEYCDANPPYDANIVSLA
ncbi:hypothetical protein [Ekhidna sp.]|uniref:hypothetical protein n=1 Tax=Ekhidna sp. TaxID=2608089 RepID=UPI003BAAFC63